MIHGRVRYTERRRRAGLVGACVLLMLSLASACGDDGGIPPGALRFGQLGKIVIDMDTPPPLALGTGHLRQILAWGSSGAWSLQESISYRGLVGDDDFERYTGDPGQSAGAYAEVITQLNETPGLELDVPELPQDLDPECGPGRTRLTFTMQDDAKEESRTWIRCVSGSLSGIKVEDAGDPNDLAASRLALAVQLVRDATVGNRWTSPYGGSVAFGTLDRGEDSGSSLQSPTVIFDPSTWQTFWLEHAGSRPLPDVDFDSDMVVVGIVGPREEAGDSVEVRRILQIDDGTRTEIVERVPGDFCAPAARTHVPYHIVVAPRTPPPRRFAAIKREEVPCGR